MSPLVIARSVDTRVELSPALGTMHAGCRGFRKGLREVTEADIIENCIAASVMMFGTMVVMVGLVLCSGER